METTPQEQKKTKKAAKKRVTRLPGEPKDIKTHADLYMAWFTVVSPHPERRKYAKQILRARRLEYWSPILAAVAMFFIVTGFVWLVLATLASM